MKFPLIIALVVLARILGFSQNIRIVTKDKVGVNTKVSAVSEKEIFTSRGNFAFAVIDSIYLEGRNANDQKFYDKLQALKIPVVFTNRPITAEKFIPNIRSIGSIEIAESDGGSVSIKIPVWFGKPILTNQGSSLRRKWLTLNDPASPLQLANAGINTTREVDSDMVSALFLFRSVGSLNPLEPITAYSVYHVLYDAFGNYIRTLENTTITDLTNPTEINPNAFFWRSYGNEVYEYLVCVSFVRSVRTKEGTIWHCDFKALAASLHAINVKYEESYEPKPEVDRLEEKK